MHRMIFVIQQIHIIAVFHLQYVKMIHNIPKIFVNVHQHIQLIMSNKNVVRQLIESHFSKQGFLFIELKVYSGLSPSNTALPFDECGKCQVDNALCAFVGNQTTCWCQAGFIKNGNKCRK